MKFINMSDASSSTFNDSKNLSTGKSLCTICHNEVVKYKCPSCSTRSCSVECVKKHKIESNCSGELKLPEIKSKEEILYNDFRFLENISSKVEKALLNPFHHYLQDEKYFRNDLRKFKIKTPAERNPSSKYSSTPSFQNGRKGPMEVPNYLSEAELLRKFDGNVNRYDIPISSKRLRAKAKARGVRLLFMPRNMSRRINNTTYFNAKEKSLKWKVMLKFVHAEVNFEVTVDESATIGFIVSHFLDCDVNSLKCHTPPDAPVEDQHFMDTSSSPQNAKTVEQKDENYLKINNSSSNNNDKNIMDTSSSPQNAKTVEQKDENDLKINNSSSNNNDKNIMDTSPSPLNAKTVEQKDENDLKMNDSSNNNDKNSESIYVNLNSFCPKINSISEEVEQSLVSEMSMASNSVPRPLTEQQKFQFSLYQSAGLANIAVVFQNEDFSSNEKFKRFYHNDSLKDSLAGLTVVEHPIFLVVRKDHVYEIVQEKYEKDEIDEIMQSLSRKSRASFFFSGDYVDD